MNNMPLNRVGDVVVHNVTSAEHRLMTHSQIGTSERSASYEEIVFYREGLLAPPVIEVPGEYEVVANGVSFGVQTLCCTGRDPNEGGYLTVKWRH